MASLPLRLRRIIRAFDPWRAGRERRRQLDLCPTPILWIGRNSLSGERERDLLRRMGHPVLFYNSAAGALAKDDQRAVLSDATREILHCLSDGLITRKIGTMLHAEIPVAVIEDAIGPLDHFIRAFPGLIIYRCSGSNRILAHELGDRQVVELASQRDNLVFAPGLAAADSGFGIETAALPSLEVVETDLLGLRWTGPLSRGRPALVVVPETGDADFDRRQAAFVTEEFNDPACFEHIDLACNPGDMPGLAPFGAESLNRLAAASCLIYISQSGTVVHSFVIQALLMGVPVIHFQNSLLARVLAGGSGRVSTVSEAKALAAQLAAGNVAVLAQVSVEQGSFAAGLRASQAADAYIASFRTMLLRLRNEPADAGRTRSGIPAQEWRQLDRLLRAMTVPISGGGEARPEFMPVIQCMFHVALQRDPGLSEVNDYMDRAQAGTPPVELLGALLQTAEGRALRSSNRMLQWLSEVDD